MEHRRHRHEVGVPTLLRIGPYRFSFHSHEHEPPHVHVSSPHGLAVVRLDPVEVTSAPGYNDPQRARIREIVFKHQVAFLRRWREYFD
jgi:hypothetical protein